MSSFDDLRIYGSGAGSDGGAQPLEAANLGGYRSSTEWGALGAFGACEALTIQRIGADHAAGIGAIECDGAGSYRWNAPGRPAGAWVAIANGNTGILEDATDRSQALRVARAGATPAVARTITLLEQISNAIAMGNLAAGATGNNRYRCLILKALAALTLVRITPYGALSVAQELPVGGAVQTIANESTAPAGVSWVDYTGVLEVWGLAANDLLGLWLKRVQTPDAGAARTQARVVIEHWS
jgi:hypothetical protein